MEIPWSFTWIAPLFLAVLRIFLWSNSVVSPGLLAGRLCRMLPEVPGDAILWLLSMCAVVPGLLDPTFEERRQLSAFNTFFQSCNLDVLVAVLIFKTVQPFQCPFTFFLHNIQSRCTSCSSRSEIRCSMAVVLCTILSYFQRAQLLV